MKVYLQYLLLLIGYLSLVNVRSTGERVLFLTTTVFAQGAPPTQIISLLPSTVTQTVFVTQPCGNPAAAIPAAQNPAAAAGSSNGTGQANAGSGSAPPASSALESSVNLGGIGQSAPPAAATPPVAANAPPAAAQPTAPAANNAAQPDIDTSGLTLKSALSLGNLAQQTMPPQG
ncbi:hypothetical protein KVR01_006721 [Diaporthe batatas]|uniref:uncharacterized protein n=1 Tax=Diaporthe batatas TaxID=748121 RepID=UPI001D03D1AA|nr:uncharacterized protein KVR01_006721 [Diaporthe batatas]KAG8163424.1 hypothetical protein KVR01_006721 [Diaporthe batatas]